MKNYNRYENRKIIENEFSDWVDGKKAEKILAEKMKTQREEDNYEKSITKNSIPRKENNIDKVKLLHRLKQDKNKLDNLEYSGVFEDIEQREAFKERISEIINAIVDKEINDIVFLDKGARHFAYFFSKAWETTQTDKPKPNMYFANIGYEKKNTNPLIRGGLLPDEKKFRGISKEDREKILKTFGENLDKKKLLIFDELCYGGNTLLYASKLFESIYQNSEIYSEWFDKNSFTFRSRYAFRNLNLLTGDKKHDFISAEELKNTPNGVFEPKDKGSIQAKSWTEEPMEEMERKDYLEKMINTRKQLYKLALEMLPNPEN